MGISDVVGNMGITDSVTGNVAKALFCVRRVIRNANGEIALDDKNITDASKKEFSTASKTAQEALLKAAKDKLKGKGSGFNSSHSLSLSDARAAMEDSGFIALEVQYNPESLSFSSESGGIRRYHGRPGMGAGGDNQMVTRTIPKRTVLRFKLIMERINVNNAFINSSETVGNASIGNVVSSASSAMNRLKGKKESYSIREYLEGFMSLLATSYTRDVIFFWGQTCFHGELTDVRTHYKMFNRDGDPILGEIDITMTQSDYNEYDNERWEDAFENLFNEDGQGKQGVASKLYSGKGIF